MNPATRSWARLGAQALAITTVVRQVRQATEDRDKLRLFDAVVNALALLTAIAIIVREIREHTAGGAEALGDASS